MVLDLNDCGKTLVPVNNLGKCLSELRGSADTLLPLKERYRMQCYNSYTDVDFLPHEMPTLFGMVVVLLVLHSSTITG